MFGWLAAGPPLLSLLYLLWQRRNLRFWHQAHRPATRPLHRPLPTLAVVVPFRNEAPHLPGLVTDLLAQDYPADRYEIILVDDHSEDGGAAGAVPTNTNIRVLRLRDHPPAPDTRAYKKAALQLGIAHARSEVIVTTDADCRCPPTWLSTLADEFVGGADVVLGPVFVTPARNFCEGFQALDLAAYQLFTAATVAAGTPALANGANFAFRRAAFTAVNGYAGVDHLPSGDDVLLLHKFVADGRFTVAVSAQARGLVDTRPVGGWRALWDQRLRWAGKAGHYGSEALKQAQVLAYLTSLGVLLGLLFGFWDWRFALGGLLAWAIKAGIDLRLLRAVCRHYGHPGLLRWYAAAQLLYPFYLVGVGSAALLGLRAGWKGRPPA
ncbi:glycosyltransferase [Neolewinella litorea]|uniref:Glycosyltransferase n=1 Tax=Neolewinella litorea TaxID=2562452 RepID=A0A4S4NQM1_9BACT|nr:glycosyltransferase [Neolewinella litorea]THH40638.1 glycosyltransferase [Neolewinella litorea]